MSVRALQNGQLIRTGVRKSVCQRRQRAMNSLAVIGRLLRPEKPLRRPVPSRRTSLAASLHPKESSRELAEYNHPPPNFHEEANTSSAASLIGPNASSSTVPSSTDGSALHAVASTSALDDGDGPPLSDVPLQDSTNGRKVSKLSSKAAGKQRASSDLPPDLAHAVSSALALQQPDDSSAQLRLAERAARLLPVRLASKLYVLIRRVLRYFGVKLRIRSRAQRHLEAPVSVPLIEGVVQRNSTEEAPPSYEAATAGQSLPAMGNTIELHGRLKWPKLPSFRTQTHSTISINTTSSDEASPPSSRRSSVQNKDKPLVKPAPVAVALAARPKILVLDLDETLIHSTSRLGGLPSTGNGSWGSRNLSVRVVEVVMDGRSVVYHVYKRPWVDLFLRKVGLVVLLLSIQALKNCLSGFDLVYRCRIYG